VVPAYLKTLLQIDGNLFSLEHHNLVDIMQLKGFRECTRRLVCVPESKCLTLDGHVPLVSILYSVSLHLILNP